MSRKNSRRRHFVMNDKNGANGKNQMPTLMQKFCIDSNIMLNTARKCSLTGKIVSIPKSNILIEKLRLVVKRYRNVTDALNGQSIIHRVPCARK